MREVEVDLGDRSYPVLVGPGARHRLGEVVPVGTSRAAVVTQDGIPWEVDSGFEQRVFTLDEARRPRTWRRSRSSAGASPAGACTAATWWWPSGAAW